MGRFDNTKATIDANIRQNGNQEITGQIMNSVLNEMMDATDAELTELGSYIENLEYVRAYIDADGRFLWGIKRDGNIFYGVGVPQQVVDYIASKITELGLNNVNEIVSFIGNLTSGDNLTTLLAGKVNAEEGKSLIESEFANEIPDVLSVDYTPEFISVDIDSEGKILGGRKVDGTKFENVSYEIGGHKLKNIKDVEGRTEICLDSEDKIVSYRDKDGVLHELSGIKSKTLDDIIDLIPSNSDIRGISSTNYYKINMFNKMLAVGDSVTQGMVTEGTQEYPSIIQRVVYEASWPTKFGRLFPHLEVTNEGYSGITATGWYQQRYAQVNFSLYDIVFFMLGANGWLSYDDLNVEGTNTNDYRKIIQGARQQNPNGTFIIMRYPGVGSDFMPILEFLAEENDCILLDLWNTDYIDLTKSLYHGWYLDTDDNTAKYDNSHFTRKGYNALAYVISRLLANKLTDVTEY